MNPKRQYVRNDMPGSSAWQKKTLREFFEWVEYESQESISPEMFCQFNHPNSYSQIPFTEITNYEQGNTVIGLLTAPPLRYPRIAASYGPFALIELDGTRPHLYEALNYHISPEEEYQNTSNVHLWQQALQAGWRLAPALNEDNHLGDYGDKGAKTVIWSEDVLRDNVLNAVKKRHVYATENRHLNLKFWAEEGGRTPVMGDTTRGAGTMTLRAIMSDGINNTSVSRVEVIEIRKRIPVPGVGPHDRPMQYNANTQEYSLQVTPEEDTVCYYLRVEINQPIPIIDPLKMAYSAPIWITAYQIQTEGKRVPRGTPVQITAKLSNRLNNQVLAGKNVRFCIGSQDIGQGTTDSSGTATIEYSIPPTVTLGDYTITVEHTTDEYTTNERAEDQYLLITANATLTVLENSATTITVPNKIGEIGQTVTLTATLHRACDDWIVRDRLLTFKVDNEIVGTARTNINGIAQIDYRISESSGNGLRTIHVEFAGDTRYTASTGDGTLKVGNVVFVRPDGFDENNGATWETAKRTVQAGVNAAAGLAQVWIAEGVYTEQVNLIDGTALYGGFAGDERSFSQRNWQTHLTTIAVPANQNWLIRANTTAQAPIRLDGLTLKNSRGSAADLNNCSPTIASCTVRDSNAGINLNNCFGATIRGNTFQGSGISASVGGSPVLAQDNRVINCSLSIYGDSSSPPDVTLSNNTLSNGGSCILGGRLGTITATNNHGIGERTYIWLAGTLARSTTLVPQDNCRFGVGSLTVESGATLTLSGGVVLHASLRYSSQATPFSINGDLRSSGTPDNPAIITSTEDNSPYGGTDTTPYYYFWGGLLYPNGNNARISNLTIRHAYTAIQADTAFLTDCTFLQNQTAVESRSGGGVYRFTAFSQNETAVQNNGTTTIDARYCEWGDPSGPYNALSNPNGRGNPVSDRVLFFPQHLGGRIGELSGRITLQGIISPSRTLAFTFRSANGNFTRNVALDSTGQFRVSKLPLGRYAVAVKAPQRLQKVTDVVIGERSASMNALLPAGDANEDNAVDVLDLTLLILHYNQQRGTGGYLEAVDFNEDGSDDVSDLLLLIQNYNRVGDP